MATFVVVHGAWSGAHAWRWVRPLLRTAGHDVFTPLLTGPGERAPGDPGGRPRDARPGRAGRAAPRGSARGRPPRPQLRRHGDHGGGSTSPRTHILCTEGKEGQATPPYVDRIAADPAWRLVRLPAGHVTRVTAPSVLTAALVELAED